EIEAGVTQNEPKQIAVQQAIEKAVTSLIIEGAELGVWDFADTVKGQDVIASYRNEKYGAKITPEAQAVIPPKTENPTRVVETTPLAPRVASVQRRAQPARAPAAAPAAQPVPPPPPAPDETVGSVDP